MRVIAKSMPRKFWESNPKYRDAKKQMTEWYNYCTMAKWDMPHKLKAELRNASIFWSSAIMIKTDGCPDTADAALVIIALIPGLAVCWYLEETKRL